MVGAAPKKIQTRKQGKYKFEKRYAVRVANVHTQHCSDKIIFTADWRKIASARPHRPSLEIQLDCGQRKIRGAINEAARVLYPASVCV